MSIPRPQLPDFGRAMLRFHLKLAILPSSDLVDLILATSTSIVEMVCHQLERGIDCHSQLPTLGLVFKDKH